MIIKNKEIDFRMRRINQAELGYDKWTYICRIGTNALTEYGVILTAYKKLNNYE